MTAVAAVLALGAALTAVPQGNVDGTKFDVGSKVTIQGCVVAAEAPGSFVFTGIREWPVPASPNGKFGPRHYWLDKSPDELAQHIGHTVQISGTIVDLRESEVEREPGGWHEGTRVAIERPGRDVFTAPGNAGVAPENLSSREDMKITLLKLHVEEFLVVLKACLPAR